MCSGKAPCIRLKERSGQCRSLGHRLTTSTRLHNGRGEGKWRKTPLGLCHKVLNVTVLIYIQ